MFELLIAPQNILFSIALAVVLIIAFLEGVGALLGAGLSDIFSSLFPDTDVDFEVDNVETGSAGAISRTLSWLRVGKVPIIILIIIFLVGFGISGLVLQSFILSVSGFMLPAVVASIPAFFLSLPIVRVFGDLFHRIIPKDETSAVSSETFIGRVAIITLGYSKEGHPAEGKVKDKFGRYHYIMIEPDNKMEIFQQGKEVLLVRHTDGKFFAIENDKEVMGSS